MKSGDKTTDLKLQLSACKRDLRSSEMSIKCSEFDQSSLVFCISGLTCRPQEAEQENARRLEREARLAERKREQEERVEQWKRQDYSGKRPKLE